MLNQSLSCFSPSTSATWLWKYSPSKQRLFLPADDLASDFYHVSAGLRQSLHRLYHCSGTVSSLPLDAQAATVSLQGPHACLLSARRTRFSASRRCQAPVNLLSDTRCFRLLFLRPFKKSRFHWIFAPSLRPPKMALPVLSATDLSRTSLGPRPSPLLMLSMSAPFSA